MLAGVVAHSAWIPTTFPVLRRYANRLAMHDNIQLAGAVDVLFLHGALDRQVRTAPYRTAPTRHPDRTASWALIYTSVLLEWPCSPAR